MMDAILPSETVVLTKATRRNIPEDGIFPRKVSASGRYSALLDGSRDKFLFRSFKKGAPNRPVPTEEQENLLPSPV
jgi:hypothetical protein